MFDHSCSFVKHDQTGWHFPDDRLSVLAHDFLYNTGKFSVILIIEVLAICTIPCVVLYVNRILMLSLQHTY